MTVNEEIAIECLIQAGECSGRDLQKKIHAQGVKLSGPYFYQMMAHLEDLGKVKGWYEAIHMEDQVIKERWYKLL